MRDVDTRNDEKGGQAQKSLVTRGLRWPVGRKNRPAPWLSGQRRGESITLSRPQGSRPLAGAGRVRG